MAADTPPPGHLRPGLTSIVTLTWNCAPLLRRCVESVLLHTGPPFELIVVDNGSRDDTPAYLRELARRERRLRVLRRPRNEGVYARNYGMAVARGEFLCWVDSDVEVGPGWLEILRAPLRDPAVGGVGIEGVLLTPDWQHAYHSAGRPPAEWAGRAVDLVTGYCFLFRNLVWRIGVLDPRFSPFWNEDADWSLRLKELGYRLVLAPAPVVHRRHGSSRYLPDLRASVERNNALLLEKWEPRKRLVLEALRGEGGAPAATPPSRPEGA